MTTQAATTARGTVIKVLEYGAIVRLDDGRTGLVHISQITDGFVRDIREYFGESDQVTVRILGLNTKGRLEFSTKQMGVTPVGRKTNDQTAPAMESTPDAAPSVSTRPASFEERLTRFLKDSDERMRDLKRHSESRRARR